VVTADQAAFSSARYVAKPGGHAARVPAMVTRMLLAADPDSAIMPPTGRLFGGQQQNVEDEVGSGRGKHGFGL